MPAICPNCKGSFEPEHSQQFYCSTRCVREMERKLNPIFSEQQEEEMRKIVTSELKKQIGSLNDEISALKEELGNHRHDSEGVASHNY